MPNSFTGLDEKSLLKQQNLKLKNQIAHLDCLLRKKESLTIEINRIKKLIQLNRKMTKVALKETFPDSVLENGDLVLAGQIDEELSDLSAEFTLLEHDFDFLNDEFQT